MKKAIAIILAFSTLFALFACTKMENPEKQGETQTSHTADLPVTEDIWNILTQQFTEQAIDQEICSVPLRFSNPCISSSPTPSLIAVDFALNLFTYAAEKDNVLISPVSVILALCLAAEGADGETLTQMESVLGTDISTLRYLFGEYVTSKAESKELKIANSVWLNNQKNRLTVEENYVDICKQRYSSEIFSEPFDDSTLRKLNKWVEDKTDGTIRDMLSNIPPYAVMYLINTVLFDAEWQSQYLESQIHDGTFNNSDGTKSDIKMMYSMEYDYFRLGKTNGIVKKYADSKYAFAAMLPDEGVSLKDAAASFSGEEFLNAVTNTEYKNTNVRLPQFEFESQLSLREALQSLGITDAFDSAKADFTRMGKSSFGPLFIDEVYHKTFIKVAEKGTKAGAATAVIMADSCAPFEPPFELTFDRPFIYAIIETETGMPVFFGCVTNFNR